jgi:hypothetical protein
MAFKNALRGIRDPNSPEGQLETDRAYFNAGFGDKRAAMRASEEASRKAYNEEQKQLEEEGYAAHREISSDPSDERIAERNRQIQNDIRYSADKKALAADNAGRLINMPYEQRKIEMAQSGANVTERKPHLGTTHTGGANVFTTTDPFSGKVTETARIADEMSPADATKFPVDYQNRTNAIIQGENKINQDIKTLNTPGLAPAQAQALQTQIAADQAAVADLKKTQEKVRRETLDEAKPKQELESLLRDRAALVAKLGPAAKNDPVVVGMTARINYLTTHPEQLLPRVDLKKVASTERSASGDIRHYNAYGEELNVVKGVAKPTPEHAKRAAALPGAIDTMEQSIKTIDQMIGQEEQKDVNGKITQNATAAHKGFQNAVGMGWPGAKFISGTHTAGFMKLFDQVKGQAFMSAYAELKGGGSITEKEGEKGTAARTRMNTATSEQEFFNAARELQGILRVGLARAKAKNAEMNGAAAGAGGVGDGTFKDI